MTGDRPRPPGPPRRSLVPTAEHAGSAPPRDQQPAAPAPYDPEFELVGQVVADAYRVEQVLGRGGMGVVYRAHDQRLGRTVALKTMPRMASADPNAMARFEREALMASRVVHPGLAQIYDYGRLKTGEPYLVMELVAGVSLAELLTRDSMGLTEIVERLIPVAQALDALHAAKIVHRDVKPENVITQPEDRSSSKLIDFGLAVMDQAVYSRLTGAGFIMGTPEYMAPESVGGDLPGPAGDIYALAVTVFELLAGRAPFEGAPVRVLQGKQSDRAPTLSDSTGRLFLPGVEDALGRSLRRDPKQRHPTAMALMDELSNHTRKRR